MPFLQQRTNQYVEAGARCLHRMTASGDAPKMTKGEEETICKGLLLSQSRAAGDAVLCC